MISPSDMELLEAYLDDCLSEPEARALEARLKSQPELAESYVLLAREEALLSEWAHAMSAVADWESPAPKLSRAESLPRAGISRFARRAPQLAAACLLALLAAGLALFPARTLPAPSFAWIEEIQGEVLVGTEPAQPHHLLRPGDEIRTAGEGGFAVVRFPDRTRLLLGSDSLLRLQAGAVTDGKRLFLAEGYLHADVSRQPAAHPMILATPHAQIRVLGTRFSSSAVTRGTRIELEEGRIQVSSAGRSVDVQGGRYFVDVPQEVLPREKTPLLPPQPLPPAVTAPRHTLPRGDGPVQALAWAPRGGLLAIATVRGEIDLWDTAERTLLHRWETQQKRIRSLTWSPDGNLLATGGDDRTVKIWEAHSGRLRWSLPKFRRDIEAVVFSPESDRLAVAAGLARPKQPFSADVTLWDVRAGTMTGRLGGHTDAVTSVAFTPDGRTIASCSRDGTIRLWDRETLTEVDCLTCGEPVLALACSPDGMTLAAASRERLIRLWDLPARQLRIALQGHPREVRSLDFSPDGRRLASAGSDPSIRVWDVQTGRAVAHFQGRQKHAVAVVRFSPDGRTLASGGWDRLVKLWDTHD